MSGSGSGSGRGSGPTGGLTPATIGRRVGVAALVVILVLAPLVVRTWIDGRAQLHEADAAAEAGDMDGQIRHLGRAGRWRLPIAGHDEAARARLRELGGSAAEAGELHEALTAWRELRRVLLGTRAVGVVDPEGLREANAAIVDLMARQASADGATIERERWAAELEQDSGSRWRSLLAAACFAGWLGACVGFFAFGIGATGRLEPRLALRWGSSALVLMIAWILLM